MGGTSLMLLFSGVAAAATTAAALAWRGRRVDDHPHCRRCGFDLFGRPAGSARCAECGADLTRRRAVRAGRRARRWRVLVAAVPVLLVGVGGAGVLGWGRARGVDWKRHVPVWWLIRAADGRDAAARDVALAELARRIAAGTLPADREAALVDKALAYQADPERPWVRGWGGLVEAARRAGRLPDDKWEQYGLNAVAFHLAAERPVVRPCDELRFQVFRDPDRTSGGGMAGLKVFDIGLYASPNLGIGGHTAAAHIPYTGSLDWRPEDMMPPEPGFVAIELLLEPSATARPEPMLVADLSDAYPEAGRRPTDTHGEPVDEAAGEVVRWDPDLAGKLTPGPQTTTLTIIVRPLWRNRGNSNQWRPLPGPPTDHVAHLRATWTLAPSPKLNRDPAKRAAVEASLASAGVRVVSAESYTSTPHWQLAGGVACDNPPVDLAFALGVRIPGFRGVDFCRPPPPLYFPRGARSASVSFVTYPRPVYHANLEENVKAETVDLLLRPDPAMAPVGTAEVWGETVVLKGVPVKRTADRSAATQPAADRR